MIKAEKRVLKGASLHSVELDSSVTGDIESGQHFKINSTGKAIRCTGGFGMPTISERHPKRDNVTSEGNRITLVSGAFNWDTNSFEGTGTYAFGTPLKISANGLLVNAAADNTEAHLIVARAMGPLVGGFAKVAY